MTMAPSSSSSKGKGKISKGKKTPKLNNKGNRSKQPSKGLESGTSSMRQTKDSKNARNNRETSNESATVASTSDKSNKTRSGHKTATNNGNAENDDSDEEMTLEETCDLIAELSESILQDPHSAISPSTSSTPSSHGAPSSGDAARIASPMRQLLNLIKSSDPTTARYSIMSMLAVFCDILPSYRIRLPTDAEKSVQVQKEVKQLWDYERNLLQYYQSFLKVLEQTWNGTINAISNKKSNSSSPSSSATGTPSPLSMTCLLALTELLKSAPHFNFRHNILQLIVRHSNHPTCHEVQEACCHALEYLFAHDAQGEYALEATRAVCKMIRDRQFRVSPRVVQTFQKLPLRVHLDEAQAAKMASQQNAKKRKKDKDGAAIETEIQEGSGQVNKILLARYQSEMLQAVTVTYFSILKNTHNGSNNTSSSTFSKTPTRHLLLPVALEGLTKIAHLIDMDTVLDLLDVLKTMLSVDDNGDDTNNGYVILPLEACLNGILCAFSTLSGPGRELQIDVKEYIIPLYTHLPRLALANNSIVASTDTVINDSNNNLMSKMATTSSLIQIVLSCLDAAFLKRREYSTVRLAAFCKQLATLCLHDCNTSTKSMSAPPLLAFLRQLLQRYNCLHPLLENELDVICASGSYDPNVTDPEHANPFSTCLWELSLLSHSISPLTAHHASHAAALKVLQLPAETPDKIRVLVETARNDLRISSTATSHNSRKWKAKKHPLAARDGTKHNVRFIQPQTTAMLHLE